MVESCINHAQPCSSARNSTGMVFEFEPMLWGYHTCGMLSLKTPYLALHVCCPGLIARWWSLSHCQWHHSGLVGQQDMEVASLEVLQRTMNAINDIKPLLIEPRRLNSQTWVLGWPCPQILNISQVVVYVRPQKISTLKILGYTVSKKQGLRIIS